MKKILSVWNKFWFKKEIPYSLGLFRIIFGLYIILIIVISYPQWGWFYGADGLVPFSEIGRGPHTWTIFSFSSSNLFTYGVFWISFLSGILFTVGFFSRTSSVFLFIIFISLLHRNAYIINGQDQIIGMLLFFSMFAPIGSCYSLDYYFKSRKNLKKSEKISILNNQSLWIIRLMQIAIANVYLLSASAKLFGENAWRDGTAIYYLSLSDRYFRYPNINFFHSEIFSIVMTYGTLIIEMAFPLLVWFHYTRPYVLSGIAMFHIGTLFLMPSTVFYFGLAMLVSLILFLPNDFTKSLVHKLFQRE